ncbi:Strictosidine synthase, partial [Thalictrum thalictroides]
MAFDCNGEGPYTGVAGGIIYKWQNNTRSWTEFAVTAHNRRRDCDGSTFREPICGRPLGLQFNKRTCELYIADAYFGLMKVGRNGGVATQLASSAEGRPFRFTNALDIDQETGVVYFTDSSTRFQRRDHLRIAANGDSTGRLMTYDPVSRKVTVLLKGLSFANGVALSKDRDYVLVAETSRQLIQRYWLKGLQATTHEVFAQVPGSPDNIKINDRGQFWVALNNGRSFPSFIDDIVAVRLDEHGRILERRHGNGFMQSISEVKEIRGTLFVGSV